MSIPLTVREYNSRKREFISKLEFYNYKIKQNGRYYYLYKKGNKRKAAYDLIENGWKTKKPLWIPEDIVRTFECYMAFVNNNRTVIPNNQKPLYELLDRGKEITILNFKINGKYKRIVNGFDYGQRLYFLDRIIEALNDKSIKKLEFDLPSGGHFILETSKYAIAIFLKALDIAIKPVLDKELKIV